MISLIESIYSEHQKAVLIQVSRYRFQVSSYEGPTSKYDDTYQCTGFLGSFSSEHIEANLILPRDLQQLILDASQVQIGRSHLGMPSCKSKYGFVRVRILIPTSKMIYSTWRPLYTDPGDQQGTDRKINSNVLSCMSK